MSNEEKIETFPEDSHGSSHNKREEKNIEDAYGKPLSDEDIDKAKKNKQHQSWVDKENIRNKLECIVLESGTYAILTTALIITITWIINHCFSYSFLSEEKLHYIDTLMTIIGTYIVTIAGQVGIKKDTQNK